jgi:hypothetical protein
MKKILTLFLFTCMSCSAFASALVVQADWRWRNDDGSESSATWKAAQNDTITQSICDIDDSLRLRILFGVGNNPGSTTSLASLTVDGQISYSTDPAGTFTKITKNGSVNAFVFSKSIFVPNATPTTQQLTAATGVYAAGQVLDSSNTSSIIFSTPGSTNTVTEYEWVIQPTINIQPDTYYFKLESLSAYGTLPSVIYTGNPVDASTSLSGSTITANSATGTYVWVDCNNSNTPVPGETAQSFTATSTGSYAVIVTESNCSKTSSCTSVTVTGLSGGSSNAGTLKMYPVPNSGSFMLEAPSALSVEVYNSVGQLVLSESLAQGLNNIELDNAINGVYFIVSIDEKGNRSSQRFVVSK